MTDNTNWNIPDNASLNALHDVSDVTAPSFDPATAFHQSRIDLSRPLEPPKWVFSVIESDGSKRRFGTLGNFSVIQGKAKSRKSTLTSIITAAALSGKGLSAFESDLPDDKRTVLVFDTEQDEYDVQQNAERVLRMTGHKATLTTNLHVHALRTLSSEERLKAIEFGLYNTPNVGFAVIDGIRDLLKDFNDLNQTADLISALMRWTGELQIHILVVIHTNKGDSNARGHLGSELMNKAETAVSVVKDANNDLVSCCQPEYNKGREFTPFAFRFDDAGLPEIVSGWTLTGKAGRFKKPEPALYEIEMKLPKIFGTDAADGLPLSELKTRLQAAFHNVYEIGEKKAEKLIRVLVEEQLLKTTGTPKTRKCKYHPTDGTKADQIP